MKFTTALLSLSALASPLAAQSPFVPTGQAVAPTVNPGGTSYAASVVDDFETFSVAAGGATVLAVDTLDDLTVVLGQGPNLVAPGCTYYAGAGGTLQWNGAAYYGTTSQNILSNTAGTLTLLYDVPVGDVSFDLDAYSGFADTAVVTGYDGLGILVFTSAAITLPGGVEVPYSYTGPAVKEIRITGSTFSWSPLLDNHAYGAGGPTLTVTGACPGLATIEVSNATPFGGVALVYGPAGSFTKGGGVCAGITLAIGSPHLLTVLGADVLGEVSFSASVPAGACGVTLQAVDLGGCLVSNAVVL